MSDVISLKFSQSFKPCRLMIHWHTDDFHYEVDSIGEPYPVYDTILAEFEKALEAAGYDVEDFDLLEGNGLEFMVTLDDAPTPETLHAFAAFCETTLTAITARHFDAPEHLPTEAF